MASLRSSALFIVFTVVFLFISPAHSLSCSSQNITNKSLYENCTDLPSLNSSLHWTFHPANSSLAIAFVSPPANPEGWIAWALNPTGSGMVGAQALAAFRQSNGSMAVKTYDISSYRSIVESKLSFDVLEPSAEYSGGLMKIYATLALPKNMTKVNHVWQVGSSVANGMPVKHDFQPSNLMSKGALDLVKAEGNGTTTGGSPAGGASNTTAGGPTRADSAGSSTIRISNVVFYGLLAFVSGCGLWL